MTNETIKNAVYIEHLNTVAIRRAIHEIAEISGEEYRTRAYIESQLQQYGIPYIELEGTGLIGVIDTGRKGKHIVLRTELDALPMPEEPTNLKNPRTCISSRPEIRCHACGHDAHMAMLLTSAKIISAHKEELSGKIYLAFEEGEENGGGFDKVVNYLETQDIDSVWAIHVNADMDTNTICVHKGPRMAGVSGVDITFVGRGGHGSRPDQSVNPVFCAASFLNNLSMAFVNQIDANETVTMGITSIQGGNTTNIIPDTAQVLGTFRFFNTNEGHKAVEIMKKVAKDTADIFNCDVHFGDICRVTAGPLVNDKSCSQLAEKVLTDILPKGSVIQFEPRYGSDFFGRYMERWPGIMAHLGIKNDEYGSGAAHHNSFFDIDEDSMDIGVISTVKYVYAYLNQSAKEEQ
jgi:amidohydrolase